MLFEKQIINYIFDTLVIRLRSCEVPIIKVQEYSKERIFQKKLLMFLPYYIMRYDMKKAERDPEQMDALLDELTLFICSTC